MSGTAKGAGRVCSWLGLVLILAVVVLCLPLALPRLLGYEAYAIVSGSMEPAIPTGSLVYAEPAAPQDIAPQTVIVFSGSGGVPVTHRVVENHQPEQEFITRGDANDTVDLTPVPYRDLLGKVAFTVPVLGRVLPAFSTQEGKISLVGLLLAGLLFRVVGSRLTAEKPKTE